MAARILHVDLDAFFVEVCRRHLPELRTVDLLVVGGRRDSRGVVQSASYGARRHGVRAGMPIARAAALCPGATFVKGEFAWYREASRAVRALLEATAPAVAMASLDEAFLDYRGTERLWPVSLLPVAEAVRATIRAEAGLDCSIGIGPNRLVAKLASDYAKPRGLMEVRPAWVEGFLAGLPLAALPGIGPRTAARLRDLGLTEVAQVQALPEAELAARVGDGARALKRRAHGLGTAVVRARARPKSVSRETTLRQDERDLARLDTLLLRLAGLVAAQLRGEGLAARRVTLKLRHDDFHTVTRAATLPRATDLDAELVAAARPLLARAFGDARARNRGVRLLGLAASELTPSPAGDLFEDPATTRRRDVTRAVDRIRARFGPDAVQPGRLLPPDPQPRPDR